ncbi:hypothetical protein [Streptomyces acidiscabies]|uniref:hypothetical protein n=1 Tax=Streptomyces acidiscabies TaxID=42234 RepID=UPI000951C5C4|nr:hypothetical protein [Streptomyces acidiscabies]
MSGQGRDPRHAETQPLVPRVPGIAGEVVQRGGGRDDEPVEARFHVLPRVRHLDCLTVRTRAQCPAMATSPMSPLIARTWRSRMSPAAGDLIRRAAMELVLYTAAP